MEFEDILTVHQLIDVVEKLRQRVERELDPSGTYAPIWEEIKNTNPDVPVRSFRLSVFFMKTDSVPLQRSHFIEAAVFPVECGYKADMLMSVGNKKKILDYLRTKDLIERLMGAYPYLVELLLED